MILSFRGGRTGSLFKGTGGDRKWRGFDRVARRKPLLLDGAQTLSDLASPPGNRLEARLLIHPGEILKEEFLVPFGLSANRLAKAIGVPTNRITEIVNGTRGITGETAVLLGHAFGTTPGFLAEPAVTL